MVARTHLFMSLVLLFIVLVGSSNFTERMAQSASNSRVCSQYEYSMVSSKDISIVATLKGIINQNLLTQYVENGELNWPNFLLNIVPIFSIYIVLLIFTLTAITIYSIAWSLTFCCKKYGRKYDAFQLPKRRGANARNMCFVIVLCLYMVSTALYGFGTY